MICIMLLTSMPVLTLTADPSSFRPISIEDSILPQTDGSSRVWISDSVDILCAVKVTSLLYPWLLHTLGSLTKLHHMYS